ncbi:unnamed protein product [Lactuca saligna]|uniref:Uncharacterized protein n=1 Tax=Lactuca saligna TaxID=75948 RepID=A0AA36EC77_LACSI|nr:unnamed protein product [Lactuca saligna]
MLYFLHLNLPCGIILCIGFSFSRSLKKPLTKSNIIHFNFNLNLSCQRHSNQGSKGRYDRSTKFEIGLCNFIHEWWLVLGRFFFYLRWGKETLEPKNLKLHIH